MHPISLWPLWRSLLLSLAIHFTRPGQRRFVEWVTGLALNSEEHTITQSLLALDRPQDWKALERFAEIGSWPRQSLEWQLADLIAGEPHSLWHGYRIWAGDDTKIHRNSPGVWGTCTFHEYTARSPNRAETVRAHNWVVIGNLVPREAIAESPATFFPIAGRLYFRKGQLPVGEVFHTKCELLVESLQIQALANKGPHLAIFDGGFAMASVVRPLTHPEAGHCRIEFLTRLRRDARLCALPAPRSAHQRGRPAMWGPSLSPPQQGGRWPGQWREGRVYLYGRQRHVKWKEVVCLWRVAGHDTKVKAVVAEVEGYTDRFTLVSSALVLSGLQIVELFGARFRQEDGFRDLKQRLGWEEGRAWTKAPIERTAQSLFVTLSAMRLLSRRLELEASVVWWQVPPWNKTKTRPSVLDVSRLFRTHRVEIQAGLSEWLETEGKMSSDEVPMGSESRSESG